MTDTESVKMLNPFAIMNDSQRNFALKEMRGYTDYDAWLSKVALSSIWGNKKAATIPQARVCALHCLWTILHISVRELLAPMTPTQASRRFSIPVRTLEDWYAERRGCPDYIRLLLASEMSQR